MLLTIQVNEKNQTFEAYSRKDALKEMAGTFMYMMAKTAGKVKYPELMHGNGLISYHSDTIHYDGSIFYPDNTFILKAKTWKNKFYGLLTDKRNRTTILVGDNVPTDKPLKDYSSLIKNTFSLVEDYYWDKNLRKSSDWLSYKSDVLIRGAKISDDYELAMTMMWTGKKLNNVPHELRKINNKAKDSQKKNAPPFKVIDTKNAILFLNNLSGEKDEIELFFKEMQKSEPKNLILDARGTRNLSMKSALLLANHLNAKSVNWGVFLTRKWSDNESSIPMPSSYEKILANPLEAVSNGKKEYMEKGFYLKTIPSLPLYFGKIYMLTSKWSSNVAEALAIYLKNEKMATIVGQKSAGSPVLNYIFEIGDQYRITIPIALFYDKDGKTYHGTGVEPDVVTDEDALTVLLKRLKE
ncbi:MAG: S41 family peptidase [Prolixibacteraceae bacterium]